MPSCEGESTEEGEAAGDVDGVGVEPASLDGLAVTGASGVLVGGAQQSPAKVALADGLAPEESEGDADGVVAGMVGFAVADTQADAARTAIARTLHTTTPRCRP